MAAPVASETWAATLWEVCSQAVLLQQTEPATRQNSPSASGSLGDWVEVQQPPSVQRPPINSTEGTHVWPQQQWQVAFEILFCQAPSALAGRRPHQDDLLFFVLTDEALTAITEAARPGPAPSPLFVRRFSLKQPQLPPDLQPGGAESQRVDWRASVLLNLVMQTGFCLCVAVCTRDELSLLLSSTDSDQQQQQDSIWVASTQVHPSPSRVPMSNDDSRPRSQTPVISYPDICFATDSIADALRCPPMTEAEQCYCVLLHADVGTSWRLPDQQLVPSSTSASATAGQGGASSSSVGSSSSQTVLSRAAAEAQAAGALAGLSLADNPPAAKQAAQASPGSMSRLAQAASRTVTAQGSSSSSSSRCPVPEVQAFSGFVDYTNLAGAVASRAPDPLSRLFRDPGRPDLTQVLMWGPDWQGQALVVVSSQVKRPTAAAAAAGGGRQQPKLVQAAKGLFEVAKRAAQGESTSIRPSELQLSCSLKSLRVPVDTLAMAILNAL